MRKILITLFFGIISLSVNSSQVVFTGGIKITMPDTYKQKKSDAGDVVAFDTLTGNWFLSSKASLKKYDRSKLYDSMDTVMYKLAGYALVDSESEWFFEWEKTTKSGFIFLKKKIVKR